MSICDRYVRWVPSYRTGDLSPRRKEKVRRHLENCPACAAAERSFYAALTSLRTTYNDAPHLPQWVVARIAEEAAGSIGKAQQSRIFSLPMVPVRYVVVMAAVLAVVLSLPLVSRFSSKTPTGGEVSQVQVVADHGVVRLAWSNGHKESYTIYKSHDPRGQQSTKAYVVRGNVWTDTEPDSSPIVFYRIN